MRACVSACVCECAQFGIHPACVYPLLPFTLTVLHVLRALSVPVPVVVAVAAAADALHTTRMRSS